MAILTDIKDIALDLIPDIVDFVIDAEVIYDDIQAGEIKKQWVQASISQLLDTLDQFKDGTKEYKAMILGISSMLVDTIVGIFNMTGVWGDEITLDRLLDGEKLQ